MHSMWVSRAPEFKAPTSRENIKYNNGLLIAYGLLAPPFAVPLFWGLHTMLYFMWCGWLWGVDYWAVTNTIFALGIIAFVGALAALIIGTIDKMRFSTRPNRFNNYNQKPEDNTVKVKTDWLNGKSDLPW